MRREQRPAHDDGASRSLLDRLRPDHLDTAREPVGAVGAALSGAGAALLSLLGVALPVLLTWAVSPDTAASTSCTSRPRARSAAVMRAWKPSSAGNP